MSAAKEAVAQMATGAGASILLLLDYLYWVRDRVLDVADGLDEHEFVDTPTVGARDLRSTLVHELDVEWSWRRRLRDKPSDYDPGATLEPDNFPTLSALAERWRADEREMRAWIGSLGEADLEQAWTANGLEGYSLGIYVLHAIEHGVTELASAAAILHAMGRSTGDLGVLDALDDLAPLQGISG